LKRKLRNTTVLIDPASFTAIKHEDLIREAERERLAAQLPHHPSSMRRELALACYRLADWLDDAHRYLPPAESGPADWAADSACV
jgi:hypothetical protein